MVFSMLEQSWNDLIVERSFSPRLAHLLEVMSYPSARYRRFHVSVPGYMEEVCAATRGCTTLSRGRESQQSRVAALQGHGVGP